MGTLGKKVKIERAELEKLKVAIMNAKALKLDGLTVYKVKIESRYTRLGGFHESFVVRNLQMRREIIFEVDYFHDDTIQLKTTVHLSKYPHLRTFCEELISLVGVELGEKILVEGNIFRIDVWCDFKAPIDKVKKLVHRRGVQTLRDQKVTRETFYHGSMKSFAYQRVYEIDPSDRENHPHKKNKFTRLELSYQRGKMPIQKFAQYGTFTSQNYEPFKGTKLFEFDSKSLNLLIKKNPRKHKCLSRFLRLRKYISLMDAINDLKRQKKSFRRDILKRYEAYYHLKPLSSHWDKTVAQIASDFDLVSYIENFKKDNIKINGLGPISKEVSHVALH